MYKAQGSAFGRTLLIVAFVMLAFGVGGVVGWIGHVPAPPTNIVPAHIAQSIVACTAELNKRMAQEIEWGPWAEIANRP